MATPSYELMKINEERRRRLGETTETPATEPEDTNAYVALRGCRDPVAFRTPIPRSHVCCRLLRCFMQRARACCPCSDHRGTLALQLMFYLIMSLAHPVHRAGIACEGAHGRIRWNFLRPRAHRQVCARALVTLSLYIVKLHVFHCCSTKVSPRTAQTRPEPVLLR